MNGAVVTVFYNFVYRVNVSEDEGDLVLTVLRSQGLVGRVSVIALVAERGATNGQDFASEDLVVRQINCSNVYVYIYISSQCTLIACSVKNYV